MAEEGPEGGIVYPLGDQKSVGRDAERGMVMEAAPSAPFIVSEPDLLLELLIVALNAPAHLGNVNKIAEGDVFWPRGQPVFDWFSFLFLEATRSATTRPLAL